MVLSSRACGILRAFLQNRSGGRATRRYVLFKVIDAIHKSCQDNFVEVHGYNARLPRSMPRRMDTGPSQGARFPWPPRRSLLLTWESQASTRGDSRLQNLIEIIGSGIGGGWSKEDQIEKVGPVGHVDSLPTGV